MEDVSDSTAAMLFHEGKSFVFRGGYHHKHIAKNAGFRWSSEKKIWWTADARKALLIAEYADPETRAEIGRITEIAATEAERSIAASRAEDSDIAAPVPEGLAYLPYQLAGIAYALARRDTLFADDMGLGKTIEAIGVLNVMAAEASRPLRVCVIAPKIAMPNWRQELMKWLCVKHSVAVATGQDWPSESDVVILNYDITHKHRWRLCAVEWDCLICDESHALKDFAAKRTRAVFGDRDEDRPPIPARRRLCLTGSPILNRPVELFPMLNAFGVAEASDFGTFATRFCAARRGPFGWEAKGASNLTELQHVLRRTCMVRRLKGDVLSELPAKRYSVVELDGGEEGRRAVSAENAAIKRKAERACATAGKAAMRQGIAAVKKGAHGGTMGEMAELRYRTAIAKVPAVVAHVLSILDGSDESVLVFTHHVDVNTRIAEGLAAGGHPAAVITGATPDEARAAAVADIQSGRRRVAVLGIRASGVALTLHRASTVVFAEQDWSPKMMEQAEDRTHRLGQKSSVLVQYLVLPESYDSTMAHVVARKGGVIDEALDGIREALCLCANGADTAIRDDEGRTPADMARNARTMSALSAYAPQDEIDESDDPTLAEEDEADAARMAAILARLDAQTGADAAAKLGR